MTRNQKLKYASGGAVAVLSTAANAVPVDLTALTSAIDLSTVTAGILAVAVIMFAPQIAKYAQATIRRMFPK